MHKLPAPIPPCPSFKSFEEFKCSLIELNCELYENCSWDTHNLLMRAHNNNGVASHYPTDNNYFSILEIVKKYNLTFVCLIKNI